MNPTQNVRHWRAIGMLVLATAFWGLSFPTVKALALVHAAIQPGSGNWFTASATVGPRFVIGTVVLLVIHLLFLRGSARRRTTPAEWRQGLLLGLFAAGGMILQNDGLQFTAASTSAFLTQLTAILIPLYVAFRMRKNPGWRVWFCCALVITGVAILGQFDWRELRLGRGEFETLLGAFFFAGQILTLDRPEFAGNRVMRITLVMFATEAVVYSIMAFATAPNLSALVTPWASPAFIMLTLLLVVFCTFGAFFLMNAWQPKITATEAGLVYCFEPIFGTLLALFLPGLFSAAFGINYANETFTWTLLTGGAFITAANILLQLKPPVKS
ncbi:drug/metabolite transporter (DMT)-like permease [Ereboglobus sp. PH5-10]|uniref:DMT family transporter n=1 Tax=Ereboglobus sp. PH5-10 TaxID=2940629 RepID=UPI0024058EC8|nr:DMT family transporter [Ereboglobus sp. PH5-10]MDF9828357.1 drug/metabolite transporter (DMT)-like permease [Ereboglobus sp. PH5-10]